jgi:hypothetical protein
MTFEKKSFFEPSDILAVRFECDKCHASITVPIGKGAATHAADIAGGSCRFCRTVWNLPPNSTDHKNILGFVSSLEQISASMNGCNLKLKVEIKTDEGR